MASVSASGPAIAAAIDATRPADALTLTLAVVLMLVLVLVLVLVRASALGKETLVQLVQTAAIRACAATRTSAALVGAVLLHGSDLLRRLNQW